MLFSCTTTCVVPSTLDLLVNRRYADEAGDATLRQKAFNNPTAVYRQGGGGGGLGK